MSGPDSLREGVKALGLTLTQDSLTAIERYRDLLRERAVPLGLISASDLSRIEERHILDSLRACEHVREEGSGYDLGSGAGLPGIPLACARPDATFVLVERRAKRAGFLESVIDELGIANTKVVPADSSQLSERLDFCLARAFASPEASWRVASRLLAPGGVLIYFAGASVAAARLVPSIPADDLADVRTAGPILLESGGPLAIMTRK